MDQFHDIRPYNDDEVAKVLANLVNNPDFIDTIIGFRFNACPKLLKAPLRILLKWVLNRQIAKIHNVDDFQQKVAAYMERMIKTTTSEVEYRGIEKLEKGVGHLFISNHRDIAMDPAFVNYGLYLHGLETVRIAIGDNLLRRPFVSDLMRLNKSFIVKRSANGVREMLAAFTQLSHYINHSIINDHSNLWIAQKEGRAKDGIDKTDIAIIKMFYMSQKKQCSFAEAMKQLNIVPVSISYEYDSCDVAKASELYEISTKGNYEKAEFEDIESLTQGIVGHKGKVVVTFGDKLEQEFATPEDLVAEIDRQIVNNYEIHQSNMAAYNILHDKEEDGVFASRIAECPQKLKTTLLEMYANPLIQKKALDEK